MAGNHEHGTEDEHGGTFAFMVEEVAQDGGDGCGSQREDEEHPAGLFGRIAQVALQHVDGILLEGEDGRVVEHAQQRYQPEHLAREDIFEVRDFEGIVFLFAAFAHLLLEFLVHEGVGDETDEADGQQNHGHEYGARYVDRGKLVGQYRRTQYHHGYTHTGDSHLYTHGQSHLFTLDHLTIPRETVIPAISTPHPKNMKPMADILAEAGIPS